MKKLTFEQMAFSRASDAWCPFSGRAVGPNAPRVHPERILASVGTAPIYYRFSDAQGYVRYSNEEGCYDRLGEQTHVFTEELDNLETALDGVTNFDRGPCGSGLSQGDRPLEVFRVGPRSTESEWFVVDTLIHGNEPDGILGTLKAFEILATHPDFAPLRDQFTLALLPCCNPDGYYLGQRDLDILDEHPSGIPTGINLNRVWPWFWEEFMPTSGESKGYAPIICSLESMAMEAFRTQFDGAPIKIAWSLDQHSTAGDGARYMSRDRCFRNLEEDEQEKLWSDWTIWRLARSIQARRVHEGPNPDLWFNYFRSRWRPHWHSYLSTLSLNQNGGIPCCSFVGEHNKVSAQVVTSQRETYKSASDFNFDHIISMALVAQGGITERKSAVLVEHETGQNQLINSSFSLWSGTTHEYRPQFYTGTRINVLETTKADQHMQSNGHPARLEVNVLMELPVNYWTDAYGGCDINFTHGDTSYAILIARSIGERYGVMNLFQWNFTSLPTLLKLPGVTESDAWTDAHKQFRLGKLSSLGTFHVVGLGDNDYATTPAVFFTYDVASPEPIFTTLATHTTPLVDAGAQLDYPNGNLYIFGGITDSGISTKVFKADCTADTFTEVGSDLLGGVGGYGMGSCFCSGGLLDGLIALVGDNSDGELGLRIRLFNPATGALNTYYADVEDSSVFDGYPPSVFHCGVIHGTGNTLWIYGGERPVDGYVFSGIVSVVWNGTGWDAAQRVVATAGLSDDGDPEDYAGEENWIRKFRYWRGIRLYDADLALYGNYLYGGLEQLPSGFDEIDPDMLRGFYVHDLTTETFGRPSDYDFGYIRYNIHLDALTWQKTSITWSLRSGTVDADSQSAAYARLNSAPGDSADGILTARRVRTYYMHPPQWWFREQCSVNMEMSRDDRPEDEIRFYARGYRQSQETWVDAPMVQIDTQWPSSWSPYGITREAETATWASALDPRWFRLQLDWLPSGPFMALTNDTKLVTIGGEGGRFELWAVNPDDNQREYNRVNVVGTSEPVLRLKRIVGEDTEEVDIPCYWGGYIRDIALGRFDSSVQIEIWNHARHGSGLIVRNGWAEGWIRIPGLTSISAWSSAGDVVLHGGGWWSEPQILKLDSEWKRKYTTSDFEQGALLIGDRDPTSGQVSARGTYRYTSVFTASDGGNLGDDWYIIKQINLGWNISSNKARCSERGWERWTAYPYLRDCSVLADVSAPSGGKVGLFTRLHWTYATELFAHGYAGYLHCTGASTANLVIARYYKDEYGVQQSSVLQTQAVTYTDSATVTLELEAIGSTLTLTMSGAHTGVATVVDTNHLRPGAFGLFGETPGPGQYVWADNVRAAVPSGTKLMITE